MSKTMTWQISGVGGIGIVNPIPVVILTGSYEDLERLLAFAIQCGMELHGLTDENRKKYLEMDIDV